MKEEKIWAIKDGYLVNRDGSIYALNWCNTRIMRKVIQKTTPYGYLYFQNNKKYTLSHRFVAECFISNPDNLPCINHKDENKKNNCVDNLEWCDRKYNNNYGTRNKRISKTTYQYTKDGVFVKKWNSLSEIKKHLGYNIGSISLCCNGKRKVHMGYIWSYKPL